MSERVNIKKFINCIANEDYKNAHDVLTTIVNEKVKKRCSAEYEKIKESGKKNK